MAVLAAINPCPCILVFFKVLLIVLELSQQLFFPRVLQQAVAVDLWLAHIIKRGCFNFVLWVVYDLRQVHALTRIDLLNGVLLVD